MGLIISSYKKGGINFANVYAKVSKINFNNITKIASFEIVVLPEKGSTNVIDTITRRWAKVQGGVIIPACYAAIDATVTSVKAQIAAKQETIETIVEGDPIRIQTEQMIAGMQTDPILQFEGAVSDEVVVEGEQKKELL